MSIPLALRAMLIYNRKKGGDVVMTEPMKMNIFDSVDNNHEASEDLPVISKDASDPIAKIIDQYKKWLRLYAQKMYNGHMI